MKFSSKKRGKLSLGAGFLGVAALLLLLANPSSSSAQARAPDAPATPDIDPRVKEEIDFATTLEAWGMPDYSEYVLARIKDPAAATRVKVLQLKTLLSLGKWAEVEARIAAIPDQNGQDAWAMRVAEADAKYAFGKYPDAQKIYEGLFIAFTNGPPASFREFYQNAAYKYGQMLILMGKKKDALGMYQKVLDINPPKSADKNTRRQMLAEVCELMVTLIDSKDATGEEKEKYKAFVQAAFKEVSWGKDLWWAKILVLRAQVLMIDGKVSEARKLVADVWADLEEIDKNLKEQDENLVKFSPMANCRYLLGVVLQKEADKIIEAKGDMEKVKDLLAGQEIVLDAKTGVKGRAKNGAIHMFFSVFMEYPMTSWAPDAGRRLRQIEATLKELFPNSNIVIRAPKEKWNEVEKYQYAEVSLKMSEGRYEEAADICIKVLNLFNDSESGIEGLGALHRCYVELDSEQISYELYQDMVLRHIAERFKSDPKLIIKAGEMVLRIADFYGEKGKKAKRQEAISIFTTQFRNHPRTPSMVMRMGDEKLEQKDYPGALPFYNRFVTEYSNNPSFFQVMNKVAICHNGMTNGVEEINVLTNMLKIMKDRKMAGQSLIGTMFKLGLAYRQLGGETNIINACNKFNEIISALITNPGEYEKTPEDKEANAKVLEATRFYRATSLASLKQPEGKVKGYRQDAIKSLEDLLVKNPKSPFAPASLLQLGILYALVGEPDKANKAFERLGREYPESEEAKRAMYKRAEALMKMGFPKEAMELYKRLFSPDAKFSEAEKFSAASKLLEEGENEIAAEGFKQVLATAKDQGTIELSLLGMARANIALQKYDEAVKALDQMMTKYGSSGRAKDACYLATTAYSELAANEPDEIKRIELSNKAVAAVTRIRRLEKDGTVGRVRVDIEAARIYVRRSVAEEKFGRKDAAEKEKRTAVVGYQAVMMQTTADPDVKNEIEVAFNECIDLESQLKLWKEVREDCDRYSKLYPDSGRFSGNIRNWRNKARVNLSLEGVTEPEPSTTPSTQETPPQQVQPPAEKPATNQPPAAVQPKEGQAPEAGAKAVEQPAKAQPQPAKPAVQPKTEQTVPAEKPSAEKSAPPKTDGAK